MKSVNFVTEEGLEIDVAVMTVGGVNHVVCTINKQFKGEAFLDVFRPNDVGMAKKALDGVSPDPKFIGIWNVDANTLKGAGINEYQMGLAPNELHLLVTWAN
jgi:hypothetical protein